MLSPVDGRRTAATSGTWAWCRRRSPADGWACGSTAGHRTSESRLGDRGRGAPAGHGDLHGIGRVRATGSPAQHGRGAQAYHPVVVGEAELHRPVGGAVGAGERAPGLDRAGADLPRLVEGGAREVVTRRQRAESATPGAVIFATTGTVWSAGTGPRAMSRMRTPGPEPVMATLLVPRTWEVTISSTGSYHAATRSGAAGRARPRPRWLWGRRACR